MFAVYSNTGLNFRSTIDNLYSVENVGAVSRIRNNVEEGLPKDFSLRQKQRLYKKGKITKEAESVYKKYANIDTTEPIFHVEQIMNDKIIMINNDQTIGEAYRLMKDRDIEQLPVMNSETDTLMGMVDYKMILNSLMNDLEYTEHTLNKQVDSLAIEDIITTDPITDIRRVAKVMVDFKLNALPVVDEDDNVLGIVTRVDIIDAVSHTPPLKLWG